MAKEDTITAEERQDISAVDNLLPEKGAALEIWKVSEAEMEAWELEDFVSSATVARSMGDFSNWAIGRLARGVEKKYGKDSLGEFAREINMPKSTVAAYRWVAEAFKNATNQDLLIMPWSAYFVAAGTETPMDWILQGSNENWSVEKLKHEISASRGNLKEGEQKARRPRVVNCKECGNLQVKGVPVEDLCQGHDDTVDAVDGEIVKNFPLEDEADSLVSAQ